jgi:TonB family protein
MAGLRLSNRITPFTRFLIACCIGGTIFYVAKTYLPQTKSPKASITTESSRTDNAANGTPSPRTDNAASGTPEKSTESTPIYDIVEQKPEFATGEAEMFKYLRQNIHYPAAARENSIEGKVYVNFVVNTDGSISDVKVLKGIKGGCDEETIRVVQNMPKWKPGVLQGNVVRTRYTLPVSFKLE